MTPYYSESGITIYHGDCREILPEVSGDVVVTDPPFGLGIKYDSYDDTRDNLRALIGAFMPWALASVKRTAVFSGITQVFLYPEPSWIMAVCWNTTGSFGSYGYTQWMPVLLYGSDLNGFGNVNDGAAMKSDVIAVSGGCGVGFQRERIDHPCPKPLNVMKSVLLRLTDAGAVVIDPCMGSGTTLKAAKDCGRRAIGIEIEERYCEIAAKRLAQGVLELELPA